MKFACLGFLDESNWTEMSKSERNSFLERCFARTMSFAGAGIFLGAKHSNRPGTALPCVGEADSLSSPMAPMRRPPQTEKAHEHQTLDRCSHLRPRVSEPCDIDDSARFLSQNAVRGRQGSR